MGVWVGEPEEWGLYSEARGWQDGADGAFSSDAKGQVWQVQERGTRPTEDGLSWCQVTPGLTGQGRSLQFIIP